MAMNFGKGGPRGRLEHGSGAPAHMKRAHDDENEDLNPFRKAKKKAWRKEMDHVPVDEEGSDIEEMTEGESGHTAEEKMGEGDHGENPPLFIDGGEGDDEESEYPPDDEEAEGEEALPARPLPKKKKAFPFKKKEPAEEKKAEPTFSFRRYL